jgi:hypothetical protein
MTRSEQAKFRYKIDAEYRKRILANQKRWRDRNPEYHNDYYHKNKERCTQYVKNWFKKPSTEGYQKQYYWKNVEKIRAQKRQQYANRKNKANV